MRFSMAVTWTGEKVNSGCCTWVCFGTAFPFFDCGAAGEGCKLGSGTLRSKNICTRLRQTPEERRMIGDRQLLATIRHRNGHQEPSEAFKTPSIERGPRIHLES